MKKLLLVIAIVCSAACIFTAGCGKKYVSDDNYHWPTNDASQKTPHEWDDGEILTPATAETEGSIRYLCKVCKRVKIETLPVLVNHSYSKFWSYDQNKHWHSDLCKHENVKADESEHDFEIIDMTQATESNDGEVTYRCKICQYVKNETIDYDSHEHIPTWADNHVYYNYLNHYQVYCCCDKAPGRSEPEPHTFNDEYVCTVCGKYSLLAEKTDEIINSGLFDYSVILNDAYITIPSDYEKTSFISFDYLAINFSFDNNYNVQARAEFTGSISDSSVLTGENKKEQIINGIEGVAVIKNGKAYIELEIGKDGKTFITDYYNGSLTSEHSETVGSTYIISDLEDFIIDSGLAYAEMWFENYILRQTYEMSDIYKEITEDLKNILSKANIGGTDVSNNILPLLISTVFTPIEGENNAYTIDFSALIELNNTLKDLTLDDILKAITGTEDYKDLLERKIGDFLNITVGDILDLLKASNIDIYEINALVNKYVAKYHPASNINSLEELLSNQMPSITFPEGVHVADYLDSAPVRAYKIIDLVNLFMNGANSEKITTEQLAKYISTAIIPEYKEKTVYEIISDIINVSIENEEAAKVNTDKALVEQMNEAINSALTYNDFENIDEIIEFLNDQNIVWKAKATGHQIFWHEESGTFILVDLATKTVVYPDVTFDLTEDTVLYDSDGWDVTLAEFGAPDKVKLTTDKTIYTAIDELAKFLTQSLRVYIKTADDGSISEISTDIGFMADNKYSDTSDVTDYYSKLIKQVADTASKTFQAYYGEISVKKNNVFSFDEDEFIQTIKEKASHLIPEDKNELKEIIDKSFSDVSEIITSTLSASEKGYLYEIEYFSDREHPLITSDEGNNDYLVARYNVKKSFYISNDNISTLVFDKCGSDFYELLYLGKGSSEEKPVSYFWKSGTVLSDDEVDEIKRKAADVYASSPYYYDHYFASDYSLYDTLEIMLHYYSATGKFIQESLPDTENYINDGLHDYELISGSEQDVNSEYFIKLTYRCKNCGDILYVYKRNQTTSD